MAWLEVSIRTSRDLAERVSAAMEAHEALAVTTQAAQDGNSHLPVIDREIFEPEPGTTPLWPEVEVCGLFEQDVPRSALVESLMDASGVGSAEQLRWRVVQDQVWERAWLDRFEPMRFGKRLWIVPRGMAAPKARKATVIRLDPGLAFGTGAHATTALCLQWLDAAKLRGKLVVDYGCGSGVLGIAAALKGAARVIAVDTDPQALEACEMNARNNHVHGQISCCLPDHYQALLSDTLRGLEGVDVVLANILARPLIGLAPMLGGSLRDGGRLVLSGLLDSQVDSVKRAYRRAFGKMRVTTQDGWARLDGEKLARAES